MIGEVLEKQSIETLIKLSEELNLTYVPMDAEIRKVVGEIFCVEPENTTYLQCISIAPVLSMLLGKKLKNLIKNEQLNS